MLGVVLLDPINEETHGILKQGMRCAQPRISCSSMMLFGHDKALRRIKTLLEKASRLLNN